MLNNYKNVSQDIVDFIDMVVVCKEFNTLPSEGGVLDQDQLVMRKLRIVSKALSQKLEKDREKIKKDRK